MYVPAAFRLDDPAAIRRVMRENAFATLVSVIEGSPYATHVPLMVVEEGDRTILCGHLARNNPHAAHLDGGIALAIFAGPHAYVSPNDYVTRGQVPTWNYITVHAYGTPELLTDAAEVDAHLQDLVLTFDPDLPETRPDSLAPEVFERLRRGIVVFRIPVDRLEAKAKMSQNKGEDDRQGVVAALRTRGEDATAGWIVV